MFTNRWMDKQNAVYTCNGVLALKRKEIPTHTTTWMNLEDSMLSELSQSQSSSFHHHYCHQQPVWFHLYVKFIEKVECNCQRLGLLSSGYRVLVLKDKKRSGYWLPNNVNILFWIVHFKMAKMTLCCIYFTTVFSSKKKKKKAFIYLVEQNLSPPVLWSLGTITDTGYTGSHALTLPALRWIAPRTPCKSTC